MSVNKVVYDSRVLLDLTEDTVTPEDLVTGIVAHDKSGQQITGTIPLAGIINGHDGIVSAGTYDDNECICIDVPPANTKIQDTSLNTTDQAIVKKTGVTMVAMAKIDNFGDATAADVASGKTFTSAAGLAVQGTCGLVSYVGDSASRTTIRQYGSALTLSSASPRFMTADDTPVSKGIVNKGTTTTSLTTYLSNFGDATAADVASGKTFTSAAGLKITGTNTGSESGTTQSKAVTLTAADQTVTCGSSDNNVEAYLVDATNPTVSFTKTTGNIKVYGYATKPSSNSWGSTLDVSFDGDGYYSKTASGEQTSRTSCTFGVSNGQLTGLPNLQSGTLLVVRGL